MNFNFNKIMEKGTIVNFLSQNKIFFIEDTNAENIWNSIIEILKDIGPMKFNDKTFEYLKYRTKYYDNFVELFKEKFNSPIEIKNEDDIINYSYNLHIKIICHSTNKIKLFIENKSGLIIKSKVWNCNKKVGNCVDNFLHHKIISKSNFIDELIVQIKSRQSERANKLEYHQTSCYERDYLQLCLIRDTAKKLAEDCNNKLIALSEKYTKID